MYHLSVKHNLIYQNKLIDIIFLVSMLLLLISAVVLWYFNKWLKYNSSVMKYKIFYLLNREK